MQLFYFWSRHVRPVQNLLLFTKFHENPMIFYWDMAIYVDFQNGGRPPFWNCFTTIWNHSCLANLQVFIQSFIAICKPHYISRQLPVKFHVNLIHRSEDIAAWIFHIFGLKCLFRPQNGGFGGFWTPECDYSPPRGTSLRKSASFKLSTVKIRRGVWPVGELTESVTDTDTHTQVNLYSVHA